jgi:hypothetical protein
MMFRLRRPSNVIAALLALTATAGWVVPVEAGVPSLKWLRAHGTRSVVGQIAQVTPTVLGDGRPGFLYTVVRYPSGPSLDIAQANHRPLGIGALVIVSDSNGRLSVAAAPTPTRTMGAGPTPYNSIEYSTGGMSERTSRASPRPQLPAAEPARSGGVQAGRRNLGRLTRP